MLKKTALSLFGLVMMLVCFNPPQAHAGVVVSLGPVFPRPVYVRPYAYAAPVPYVAYQPDPYFYGRTTMLRRMFVRAGAIVQAFTDGRILLRGLSIASSWDAVRTGGGKSFD